MRPPPSSGPWPAPGHLKRQLGCAPVSCFCTCFFQWMCFGFLLFFSRLFPSSPAGHLYTGGPRMCLGGIKGAAICIPLPAVRLTGRASGMRPPVARGQDQPARCRGEAGCHPGSLPEKGRSKGCHGCMGQLGRPAPIKKVLKSGLKKYIDYINRNRRNQYQYKHTDFTRSKILAAPTGPARLPGPDRAVGLVPECFLAARGKVVEASKQLSNCSRKAEEQDAWQKGPNFPSLFLSKPFWRDGVVNQVRREPERFPQSPFQKVRGCSQHTGHTIQLQQRPR